MEGAGGIPEPGRWTPRRVPVVAGGAQGAAESQFCAHRAQYHWTVTDVTPSPTATAGGASESTPIRVAIVNDYPIVVEGLARLVEPFVEDLIVLERDSGVPPVTKVTVALYDTFAHEADGGLQLTELVENDNVDHVVVYTWQDDPRFVGEALNRGASGYLSKRLDAEDLVDAMRRVAAGEKVVAPGQDDAEIQMAAWPGNSVGLTPRESEMLALITQGLTNAEIAQRAFLSPNSVKAYIRSAYRRIGVERRSQAVRWGLENGFYPVEERWLGTPSD